MPIAHTYTLKATHLQLLTKALALVTALIFSIGGSNVSAQVVVSPPPGGNNYAQLLQNFFIGGGVTVSNVQYTGSPLQIGSFSANNTNLQLQSGIVLSTGNRATVVGPNNSGSAGTNLNRPGIAQLNALAGGPTYDGAQIQFNFITQSNVVNFKYIWGSEEYPEFVGSVNDVFAFFIQGPGIPNWTNIATIPNSGGQGVSINNVNAGSNSEYYINNAGGQTVQFDGFTKVMTATANVQPCQTYTIRIMIADAFDRIYDSGVFLGDNTFNGGIVDITASGSTTTDTSSFEGCSNGAFNFTLPNALQQPLVVNYTVGGTATNGVDYQNIPNSITIPAGQTSVTIPVIPIADGISEPMETVTITYQAPCGPITTTVNIQNVDPLTVTAGPDQTICNGNGPVTLTAQASGGRPPYNYTWSNGLPAGNTAQVNPGSTTTYTVSVTAACPTGTVATDQVTVNVSAIPTATFTTNSPVCPNSPVTATYTGSAGPNATYNWTFGGSSSSSGSGQGPVTATYPTDGTFFASLTVIENSCTSSVFLQPVTVNPVPTSTFSAASPICMGSTGSLINYTGTPIQGAQYTWDFDGGTPLSGSGPGPYQVDWNTPGTKNVTLTVTANGCTSIVTTQQVVVNALPAPTFNITTPLCVNQAGPIAYTGNAGQGATYTWGFDGGTVITGSGQGPYSVQWATPGTKNVTLQVVENGCGSIITTQQVTVNAIPTTDFTVTSPLCVDEGGAITFGGQAGQNATYTWAFDGGTVISGSGPGPYNVSWPTGGTKTVTLDITENGCVATQTSATVTVNEIPTASFTATTGLCLGTASSVGFDGLTNGNASYAWDFTGGTASGSGAGPYQVTYGASGTYTIGLVVTENGCTSLPVTQSVTINPIPVANAGTDVAVCSGQPINIGSPATGTYTYNWINTTTDLVDPTQPQQQFTPVNSLNPVGPEVRTYTLEVSDNGCVATDDVLVTINPQPAIVFAIPAAQCFTGNSYSFNTTGSYSTNATFAWDFGPNTNFQNSSQASPGGVVFNTVGQQTVTVTVTDYGCTATYTDYVEVNPDPVVNFTAIPRDGCPPLEVTFTDLSGYTQSNVTYLWDFGDQNTSTEANPVHLYTESGNYTVSLQVSLSPSCKAVMVQPQLITVFPQPDASFVLFPDVVDQLNPFVNVTNTTPGNSFDCAYDFDDGSELLLGDCNPTHTYGDTGTYIITQYITNEFGCKDSYSQSVRVNPAFSIYIPNAFTPNGDGINDVFKVEGMELKDFTMYIFNRWGQTLFISNDINKGWDGTGDDNSLCQDEVYIYRIKYKDVLGAEREQTGKIVMFR